MDGMGCKHPHAIMYEVVAELKWNGVLVVGIEDGIIILQIEML